MTNDVNMIQNYAVLALEHFLKHREVVLKKLGHAQTATRYSLIQARGEAAEKIRDYDAAWSAIIRNFEGRGVTESDLNVIERLLAALPRVIKKTYDFLIEQDQKLQELIRELASATYKKALDTVKKMQSEPDPMSGLPPEQFDLNGQTAVAKEIAIYFPVSAR